MSQETRAKLSASRKGKYTGYRAPEIGAKISLALTGRRLSESHRKNMSLALRGKKRNPEHVAKTAAANRGKKRAPYKKHSAEANARKSALMLATGRCPQRPHGTGGDRVQ